MRMLGILEVSLQLKSSRKPFRKLKAPHFKTISVPAPLRRSPRCFFFLHFFILLTPHHISSSELLDVLLGSQLATEIKDFGFSELLFLYMYRLQNTDPVMYPEVTVDRNHNSSKSFNNNYLGLNSKPDLLSTEEVLCESSMSVNGYQQDGKRIYDYVRGKTCHQCRLLYIYHLYQPSNCLLDLHCSSRVICVPALQQLNVLSL